MKLTCVHEDVVREIEPRERRDAATERRTRQKIVRLRLHDVADADEARVPRHAFQLRLDAGRLQIHPADNAGDERVRVCQREQPAGFLERRSRLDGDARVDAGRIHLALQLAGEEIAAERRHRLVDPAVLARVVAPEVLVRIDSERMTVH